VRNIGIAASYTYNAYGALTTHTGTSDTPLRWNGQYQDTDTGLYYLRARYYNPVTTQFLSPDPFEALTASAYSYADGNPLNAADPMGLCPCPSWYQTAAWGIVNFFSYRSYINGAGYIGQGQYAYGVDVAIMGEAPNAGTQVVLDVGAHSIPIEGQGMVHLLGQGARLGSRALIWQVSVVATVLDYWRTPAVWNPATFLLNVITQGKPLNLGNGYDPAAPAGTG
jgi:RHS repeat-associated protein